jgi:hypothetical protein
MHIINLLEKNSWFFKAVLMAPPASMVRWLLLVVSAFTLSAPARSVTFPLSIPTRPTTFPLSRSLLAGDVFGWGSNAFNQVTIPADATNIVAVAAGFSHSLALRSNGTVLAWGDNRMGQTSVPGGLTNVVGISAGYSQSLALLADGRVVEWGNGKPATTSQSSIVQVVAGTFSAGLRADGSVVTWGTDAPPAEYTWWPNIAEISTDGAYVYALQPDGRVISTRGGCCSFAYATEIATINHGLNYIPTAIRSDGVVLVDAQYRVPTLLRATKVASTPYNYAAINADGTVVTWAAGPLAELPPLGPLTNIPPRLRGVIDLVGGYSHFLGIQLPTPPVPSVAKASVQVVNGFVVGLNVIDGGEGYAVAPQVKLIGGGGSNAVATAEISRGIVTGFTVLNAGRGYTNTPVVEIDSPPLLPKVSIATSRVGVTMQVVPGKRYQLQSSNDLPNFGPVGSPFVADKDTITQEFTVSETGQYFRIQEVP